ncbi:hypothetical protein AB205_0009000 [Aquarana catesbeiana]|uniref:Uncharacterized protein n=1 Tax=Aquarana catesbeiana TaxID=8400 RepID=A0A2G9Q4E4_AQUCT|nr:hypothetical protein AB205_0009000 [Aquarana catesbeiana]
MCGMITILHGSMGGRGRLNFFSQTFLFLFLHVLKFLFFLSTLLL